MKKTKLNLAKRLNTHRWTILNKIGDEIYFAGESAIPELIDAYDKVRLWQGRKVILYYLIQYGNTHKEVYEFGLKALKDRAHRVIEDAEVLVARVDSQKAIERFKAKGQTCPEW
jgi:hypothetical protein